MRRLLAPFAPPDAAGRRRGADGGERARTLAERIRGAELAVVPGAAHAYALERPQVALDLLLRFMTRTREEAHVAADR